jgi:curli biogenesis system outer membrane secretion channel CsgG
MKYVLALMLSFILFGCGSVSVKDTTGNYEVTYSDETGVSGKVTTPDVVIGF